MVLPRNKRRPAKPKAALKPDNPDTEKLEKLFAELTQLDEDLAATDIVWKETKTVEEKTEKTEEQIFSTVSDLAKLCHAHMTKCGVAFKPPVSVDIAVHTVSDLRKVLPAFTGEYQNFVSLSDGSEAHELMQKELRLKLRDVCGGISTFSRVVQSLLKMDSKAAQTMLDNVPVGDSDEDVAEAMDNLTVEENGKTSGLSAEEQEEQIAAEAYSRQLIRVAQTWKYCNAVQEFCKTPFLDVAKRRLKETCLVMTDAVNELKEWLDNADDEDDDPFGLDDYEDTDDEAEPAAPAAPAPRSEEAVSLAEKWHAKLITLFKLVQALASRYSSLCKADSDAASKERLVGVNSRIYKLAAGVDNLVTGFLMNSSVAELEGESAKLDDLVRDLAKSERLSPDGSSDAVTVYIDSAFSSAYGL
ncbi:hypothetical protein CJU90_1361 [Yarrowia sp. C11]|nr:hypothetical protein CKK34_0086 [Yarrowia sp. E02]KAG5371347.1 hypothetical protein CJU90_1361 [Yarrowia sp. C11]